MMSTNYYSPALQHNDAPYSSQKGHFNTKQSLSKEFKTSFEKNGKRLVSFMLFVNEALSKKVPTVLQGSLITGSLRLHLDDPNPITSITVMVEGKYIIGGAAGMGLEDNFVFLEQSETLWSQASGEPPNSTIDSKVVWAGPPFEGSLQGEYTWPISIELPQEVKVVASRGTEPRSFVLPQSFSERFIRATVDYRITVIISRRGFLKGDYRLTIPFGYLRITRPPPLPLLRQVAYQEDVPIPGPSSDPTGWYFQQPVQIQGKLSKIIDITARCTLYLAKPLAYTAGSFIPLCIKIESDNIEALDLLSSPQAIHVRVRRHILDFPPKHNAFDNGSFRGSLDYSRRAVWCVSGETRASSRVRILNGELHLKPGMMPNTDMGLFKLTYSVMLYDFQAISLEFREQKFLQEVPIEICRFHAPEPRPRPVTTPNYEPDVEAGKLIAPDTDEYSKGFY